MKRCNAVLYFESVNEILWRDHFNETSSAVFLLGALRSLSIKDSGREGQVKRVI